MDKTTLLETLKTERAQWEALLAQIEESQMMKAGGAGNSHRHHKGHVPDILSLDREI